MIIELTESIGIIDQIDVLTPTYRDMSILIVLGLLGISLYFLRKYYTKFEIFLQEHNPRAKDSEYLPRKTEYDELSLDSLDKIRDRLNRNFAILITIYGLIFAFIISENLSRAFVSWSLIIWTGWVLAIIIRSGITTIELIDIIEIKKDNKEQGVAKQIFAAKTFFRHSLYLFVPALAFLPAIYFPTSMEFDLNHLPWSMQESVFTIALGILGVFAFVYFLTTRISEFETYNGIQGFWIFTLMLISMGGFSYISASPLSIEHITLFDYNIQIPNVFSVALSLIWYAGFISLIAFGYLLFYKIAHMINDKRKQK